jgi:hypothetical protein
MHLEGIMELLIIIVGLIILGVLASRFGFDSREKQLCKKEESRNLEFFVGNNFNK